MKKSHNSLAVYIHWPFCKSICPYCDFNSHIEKKINQLRWERALLKEVQYFYEKTKTHTVKTIFFGGGTPSLMPPILVNNIIDAIKKLWRTSKKLEITLEANPMGFDISRFEEFRDVGINRLSLGIQSLNDNSLRFLGRQHTRSDALIAINAGKKIFNQCSIDMIYALPNQTKNSWKKELDEIISISGNHLSLYQLTIEPGTPFFKNRTSPATELTAIQLYRQTRKTAIASGFLHYEVSSFARLGHKSKHNLTYWRGGEYIGIGPGAHGRLLEKKTTIATHQIHNPDNWLQAVEKRGIGLAKARSLGATERIEELFLLGLRITEGINRARFKQQTGHALDRVIDQKILNELINSKYLEANETSLRATEKGRLCINAITASIVSKKTDLIN